VQPFPSPLGPERRGRFTAIALLVAGFLVTSTIAVVQFVQLRAANERIEELEAGGDGGHDGGLFGDFDDILEDVLGDTDGLFEGTGELGSLLECFGSPFAGGGEAGITVDAIARQVETLRELEFENDVRPTFLSDQEMTDRVRELFLEEYTPRIADLERRLLVTLGAVPPGTDLRALRAGTIGQQVAGFYDTDTKELVVRQAGSELSVLDRITLAHELTHALTDQALGIPVPDKLELGSEDTNLAALAVVEGDASLVMQQYSTLLGFDEQFELLDPEAIAASEAGLSDFPPYLEQELLFAYEQGVSFVCDLYAEGGWEAVNRAYAEPPTSTVQVLFPDRYRDGVEPVDPPDPPRPGKGWKELAKLQFGAANLVWLFSAPGGDRSKALEDPRGAAAEWTGGEVTLWARGEITGVSLVLSAAGPERLCEAVKEWYSRSFDDDEGGAAAGTTTFDGPRQDAAVVCGAGQPITAVGIGPDIETAIGLAAVF
jgi:hypothetical protein